MTCCKSISDAYWNKTQTLHQRVEVSPISHTFKCPSSVALMDYSGCKLLQASHDSRLASPRVRVKVISSVRNMYAWSFWTRTMLCEQTDLMHTLGESAAMGAAGVVLWGETTFAKSEVCNTHVKVHCMYVCAGFWRANPDCFSPNPSPPPAPVPPTQGLPSLCPGSLHPVPDGWRPPLQPHTLPGQRALRPAKPQLWSHVLLACGVQAWEAQFQPLCVSVLLWMEWATMSEERLKATAMSCNRGKLLRLIYLQCKIHWYFIYTSTSFIYCKRQKRETKIYKGENRHMLSTAQHSN